MDKVAIYCRLSEEDKNKACDTDDSESIVNQKEMLTGYAYDHGWQIYDIYSDDDFGGGTRNRPDFNRMLADAENHKFNIILCKTQSRFTREIELTERYIHYLLPKWGIRFVSIVDNIDTDIKASKKSSQINSLVNEWYIADMSDNIKSVLTAKRKNGYFIGAFAPYGYKKDPDHKGHLIIDEEAAETVRLIFNLFNSGYGRTKIARTLNEMGIPSPARYKVLNGEKYNNTAKHPESAQWHDYTLKTILTNEAYIGNLVQNKQHSISYKTKEVKPTKRSEWIKVENTHEPIIDMDTWNQTRFLSSSRLNHKVRPDSSHFNIFTGHIYCGKCGGVLTKSSNGRRHYLRCANRRFNSNSCEGTYVRYKDVYDRVLQEFRDIVNSYASAESIADQVSYEDTSQEQLKSIRNKIKTAQNDISDKKNLLKNLYVDKLKGEITPEMFAELSHEFEEDINIADNKILSLQRELDVLLVEIELRKSKMDIVKKYLNIEVLDRNIINLFIEKIYVHREENSKNFSLEIFWKF